LETAGIPAVKTKEGKGFRLFFTESTGGTRLNKDRYAHRAIGIILLVIRSIPETGKHAINWGCFFIRLRATKMDLNRTFKIGFNRLKTPQKAAHFPLGLKLSAFFGLYRRFTPD